MSQCSLFKNGIHITPHGEIDVCCGPPATGHAPRPQFNTWHEFKQHANNAYKQSKHEWIPGCSGCKYNEDTKGSSLRTYSNSQLHDIEAHDRSIAWAIVNSGSVCNLACRMCGPGPSSRWVSYLQNNNHRFEPAELASYLPGYQMDSVSMIDDKTMDMLYTHVLTPKLRYISFAGGEPTQSHRTEEIIKYLIEKGYARNMKMHVITNATRPFTDSWKDALDEFKDIEISVSMDGTHDNYNYIRQGADFDQVMENILYIKNRMIAKNRNLKQSLNIAYCLQALNAHKYLYDKEYYESKGLEFGYNTIHHPQWGTLASIPPELLEKYGLSKLYPLPYKENMLTRLAGAQRWMDQMFLKELGEFEKQCPDLFKYPGIRQEYYRDN